MKSNNALIIPSLGDFSLLKNLSIYINNQTSDDFEVIFVINSSVNLYNFRRIMDKELNRSYSVIMQNGEKIVGAMNTILGLNFKLIMLTDDDAEPPNYYVSNAIEFLEKHDEAGMVFGKVNNFFPDSNKLKFIRFINTIASKKSLFGVSPYRYFNMGGLISGGFSSLGDRIIEDYSPIGVCMAWKQNYIGNFRLLPCLKRGILYESYISASLWKKGLVTYYSGSLSVKHLNRISLSRTRLISDEIIEQIYSSPIVLSKIGFEIDPKVLKRFINLTLLMPRNIGRIIRIKLMNFLSDYE